MFANVKRAHAGVGSMLLACSAASLLAVTGCSSASSSSSANSSEASATASAPTAAAPSSTAPPWTAALGTGMTVVPPGTAAPGHGSPGAVVAGVLLAIKDKSGSAYCGYSEPSVQAQCNSEFAQITASQFPTEKNGAPGYIVIDGSKAVAGLTGTECVSGQTGCVTNTNPAALFTTLHTFDALWKNAITPTQTTYSLNPLVEVNGNWYFYATS